jgi:hypothetical protein
MEVGGQLHGLAALTPGKSSRYQLDRRLSGSQSWSGRCGVETSLLLLRGIQPRFRYLQAYIPFLTSRHLMFFFVLFNLEEFPCLVTCNICCRKVMRKQLTDGGRCFLSRFSQPMNKYKTENPLL